VINNDILKRLRYALNIKDSNMLEIFNLAELEISQSQLTDYFKKEEEEGYKNCTDKTLEKFLDGFIIYKRGRKPGDQPQTKPASPALDNNVVLKKIRIALELQETDMLEILKLSEIIISKSELTALFRKKGHKHYKECGDQFLRNFIAGLTLRYRG